MTNLILLAYGSEKEYKMATLATLSFWAWYTDNDARVIIYTDNPSYFKEYLADTNVEYSLVTKQKWEQMLCGYSFKFHRKMAIIDETFRTYPDNNVVFLDSDIFFYKNPVSMISDITNVTSYMHLREGTLDKQITFMPADEKAKFLNWLESKEIIIGDCYYRFTQNDYCWNAGVIGMSTKMIPYVEDVRKITEEIWQVSHMHISEQLAHTFVLEAISKLKSSHDYILHYWKKRTLSILHSASYLRINLKSTR